MKTAHINTLVTITSIGFSDKQTAYPRRMEWSGTTYNFIDSGLKTIVKKGERIAHIFTMTDGKREYCLRKEDSSWTLVNIY